MRTRMPRRTKRERGSNRTVRMRRDRRQRDHHRSEHHDSHQLLHGPSRVTCTGSVARARKNGEGGLVTPGAGQTRLFIHPPFAFRAVDRLLTNFHLPRSTLLMLVCAFGGYEQVMRAYGEAIERRYRFYSYGDAMAVV